MSVCVGGLSALPRTLSRYVVPLRCMGRLQVEIIRRLSEVRLDEAQEHALEKALARLGQLWYVSA
jgi:hypothetical protein